MSATLVATLCSGGIVGFTLGLVGGGGSILAVPLLLYVVGVANPRVAIGTSAVAVLGQCLRQVRLFWPLAHSGLRQR